MKKVVYLFSSFIMLFSLFSFSPKAAAAQKRTVLIDYGSINKEMEWENPKWVTYPNKSIGSYPSSLQYDQGGFKGTLKATKIKLTPLEKTYHKDPVYRTESKTFTKTISKKYSSKDNSKVPETIKIDEDGYKGTIQRSSISWTNNWVKNRSKSLTTYWTDSKYKEFKSDASPPKTYKGTYYDSASKKNVSYSLPKSGGLYSSASKKQWVYYRAPGAARWYDKDANYYLGFMSNNSKTYYAGKFSDSKPGEAPDKYYGIPRNLKNKDWNLIDYGWDESKVQDARDWKSVTVYHNGDWYWRSESGRLNRYRKGVWILYRLNITVHKFKQKYKGSFKLPDYVKDYTAKSTYKGKLSKKVFDHYNEYYTSSKWKVEVQYEGDTQEKNLTADSIQIVDLNKKPVTHLKKDQEYYAKVIYRNSGELNLPSHKISLQEGNKHLATEEAAAIKINKSRTVFIKFKAQNSGKNTFQAMVDSADEISESNENDNMASTDILVNNPPNVTLTYDPEDVWEGDDVKVCAKPTDEDDDQLTVEIWVSIDDKPYKKILEKKEVKSGTSVCTTLKKVVIKKYNIYSKVTDGHDENEVETFFKPKELTIMGDVLHTKTWQAVHDQLQHKKYDFYTGEKFMLESTISPYPAVYVRTHFSGRQVNGSIYEHTVEMESGRDSVNYTGSLFDPIFLEQQTSLKQGEEVNEFIFEVKYKNGVIKRYSVKTNIIGNVFDAYKFHRIF
ncbi:CARDB domain-containing protein [Bacillus swezeyi]|uniref:Peptidase n=1 Tax=Bacillus swezeyi TaxID=1925020 RepID=A0A5M8RFD9_9BACI|nr:CARDB domain-containing protein [Bacillus swezeyi]KAA6446919.1 peptidase [Bacillus swezeyi]KAA6471487.1 peptidase [Bacillus swezeyi]